MTRESSGAGKLILFMMLLVPVIVAVSVGIAVLLIRLGTGYIIGIGVPFVLAMSEILVLGILLGRSATRKERTTEERESGGHRDGE